MIEAKTYLNELLTPQRSVELLIKAFPELSQCFHSRGGDERRCTLGSEAVNETKPRLAYPCDHISFNPFHANKTTSYRWSRRCRRGCQPLYVCTRHSVRIVLAQGHIPMSNSFNLPLAYWATSSSASLESRLTQSLYREHYSKDAENTKTPTEEVKTTNLSVPVEPIQTTAIPASTPSSNSKS